MEEHTEDFQKLNISENDTPKKQSTDVSIGTLKDIIQHEVHPWEPDSLEKAFRLARVESKIMATRNSTLTTIKMEVLFLLAFHNLQG